MANLNNFRKTVTDRLADQIKAGNAPWQKPLQTGEFTAPFNAQSVKEFSGSTAMILFSVGYADPRWLRTIRYTGTRRQHRWNFGNLMNKSQF